MRALDLTSVTLDRALTSLKVGDRQRGRVNKSKS